MYRISIVAVPSQAVSLVRILQCEVGHVDSLVVAVAAAAIRVAEAARMFAGEARILQVLGGEPSPVGDVMADWANAADAG